jgi:hypothetical protein
MMGGNLACNVSLMSPILALITVFLEPLGSLLIFAILGSILLVNDSRKGMVSVFLNFRFPLVIGLVLFSLTRMGCM